VRLDPGNAMGMDIVKKATYVLDDGLVSSGLDGVLPEEAHALLADGDQIRTSANGHGRGPIRGPNPLQGMVKSTDFTCCVGRTKSPDPMWIGLFSNHWNPERYRGGGADQVHTPPG